MDGRDTNRREWKGSRGCLTGADGGKGRGQRLWEPGSRGFCGASAPKGLEEPQVRVSRAEMGLLGGLDSCALESG